MAKISEEMRLHFNEVIIPYKEKISALLAKEKTMLNGMHKGDIDLGNKKLLLCEDMIYISTLYMAQNSLSLKVLNVKNNDALNDARKVLYKAIIYMEEIVTDKIDIAYTDLTEDLETIQNIPISRRFILMKKLGLSISMLKEAFGDNSKWKLSFVELEGRFATIAKNLLDMRDSVKEEFIIGSWTRRNTIDVLLAPFVYKRFKIVILKLVSIAFHLIQIFFSFIPIMLTHIYF